MEKSADHHKNEEQNMAPKNNYDPTHNTSGNVDETDLQEMADVNEAIDELSTALDFFEQRTDNIIEQLKELLHSNREIRQQLARENEAAMSGGDANSMQ